MPGGWEARTPLGITDGAWRGRAMSGDSRPSLTVMTQSRTHLGQVATIVIPVSDQDAALAFYVDVLGMDKVNDFAYPSGERWLEVSPARGSSNLCLVRSRPDRP